MESLWRSFEHWVQEIPTLEKDVYPLGQHRGFLETWSSYASVLNIDFCLQHINNMFIWYRMDIHEDHWKSKTFTIIRKKMQLLMQPVVLMVNEEIYFCRRHSSLFSMELHNLMIEDVPLWSLWEMIFVTFGTVLVVLFAAVLLSFWTAILMILTAASFINVVVVRTFYIERGDILLEKKGFYSCICNR